MFDAVYRIRDEAMLGLVHLREPIILQSWEAVQLGSDAEGFTLGRPSNAEGDGPVSESRDEHRDLVGGDLIRKTL